jgi:hypothetical protein
MVAMVPASIMVKCFEIRSGPFRTTLWQGAEIADAERRANAA